MNIAICISGHVRDYENFSQYLYKKVIEPNSHHSIDIFFSTWDKVNSNTSFATTRRSYTNESKIDINRVLDIYNPKMYMVEEDENHLFSSYDHTNHSNNPKNVISQFYKINQVSQLLKSYISSTNKKYDLVLKTRFDVEYGPSSAKDLCNWDSPNENPNYEFKFENFELDYFHVEHDCDQWGNWLQDKIFVSNVDNYFKFAEIYHHFDQLVSETGTVVGERLIYQWVVQHLKIPIKKNFDLTVWGWQSTKN